VIPSLSCQAQDRPCVNHRHPIGTSPRCQGDDPQPVLRRPPRGAFQLRLVNAVEPCAVAGGASLRRQRRRFHGGACGLLPWWWLRPTGARASAASWCRPAWRRPDRCLRRRRGVPDAGPATRRPATGWRIGEIQPRIRPGVMSSRAVPELLRIRPFAPADWPRVWQLLEPVCRAGETFSHDPGITVDEARVLWVDQAQAVARGCGCWPCWEPSPS
jgi:hypothetical protein